MMLLRNPVLLISATKIWVILQL